MEERETIEEEGYDYATERPNDLRRLSDMPDWQVVEGEPDVRGWPLVSQNGDQIGRIDDLMVSEEAGAAVMVLSSFGGQWGMDTARTLLPIDWLELELDRNQAVFLGGDDDLKNAPRYGGDERDFAGYYDYWADREPEWMSEEEMIPVDITGWVVLDEHGHEIGKVDEIVSDDRGALAIISHGDYWGMPARRTLVPLDQLAADEEDHTVILDLMADHLKVSPEYTGGTEDYGVWYDYWEGHRQAA